MSSPSTPLLLGELLDQLRNPFFAEDVAHRDVPLLVVDLDELNLKLSEDEDKFLSNQLGALRAVVVGLLRGEVAPQMEGPLSQFDILLAPPDEAGLALVPVPDHGEAVGQLHSTIAANPRASVAMAQLLRLAVQSDVAQGLVAESLTFSMLQGGPEFAAWRAARAVKPVAPAAEPEVLVERSGSTVTITLNRPDRANAFSAAMRDGLVEALRTVHADRSVDGVVLQGAGSSFCSGGDLDEFGTTPDPGTGHHVRLSRSPAWWMHQLGGRVRTQVHGHCVGAGIEVPCFGGAIVAAPDTVVRLPEVAMGLVPGAGGTVSLTNRIGRYRTAWLAITGTELTAPDAKTWGIIDRLA